MCIDFLNTDHISRIYKARRVYSQEPDRVYSEALDDDKKALFSKLPVYPILKEGLFEQFRFPLNEDQYKELRNLKEITLIDYVGRKYKGKLIQDSEKNKT